MKVMAVHKVSSDSGPASGLIVWPDSSIVKNCRVIFMPSYPSGCAVITGIGARIDRLGKSITKKYSSRYFNEVAPVAMVVSKETAEVVTSHGNPCCDGIVADYAVICGEFIPKESLDSGKEFSFRMQDMEENARKQISIPADDVSQELEEAVVHASVSNTLKTGDIVVSVNLAGCFEAETDCRLIATFGNSKLMNFKLK